MTIAIIIAIVISLGICKPSTIELCKPSTIEITTEHRTTETTSPEVLTILEIIGSSTRNPLHRHFIKAPTRNVKLACPTGQKPDTYGICRKVL